MNYCLRVLEDQGYTIDKEALIVDFGCGEGKKVMALRNQGYNALGCDIFDPQAAVPERTAENTRTMREEGLILPITTAPYRLPFADNSVDYIFSETVFEHVENIDDTVAELARVLKPGGATFHHFPAKYSLIEQHLYVPFGGVIRSYHYWYFWALMGFRKYYQTNMSASERARQNIEHLRRAMFYRSERQLRVSFGRCFSKVIFAEESYFKVTPSKKSQLLGKLNRKIPIVGKIYRTFWANALIAAKA
jgi:ubiquinone/menaquinone biosynthesis C-methylase UbiE